MIGKTISHYKILERLGSGGMGEVYLAEDTRLCRQVALKFLTEHSDASETAKQRFKQEARAAAALQHPNLCTIHDIGEEDGVTFIVMAHIRGQTLRDRIQAGPMEIPEAIAIAVQMLRGLEEAHEQGIVHRDIKSSNVMIDDNGQVTIMDFGLAKLTGDAAKTETEITQEGMPLGTPSYMAPEQIKGETVDHRTDLWAVGVCLYEMLAGEPPFQAELMPQLLAQVLNNAPEPVNVRRKDVSRELVSVVDRALSKERDARFESAAAMRKALQSFMAERISDQEAVVPKSIAVLPFVNLSNDPDQDYFCAGITEDITSDLAKVGELRVSARMSAYEFKDRQVDAREVGKQLGVDTLLEGSVRKAGNRLRVSAQLINVADGYHLWAERYDRDMEDVFAIQDEIARSIADALRLELTEQLKESLNKGTENAEAYDFYLRGRHYQELFYGENHKNAIEMYKTALQRDPNYAEAWASLGVTYAFKYLYLSGGPEDLHRARDAVNKALSLGPELALAHAAHGLLLSMDGDMSAAKAALNHALSLDDSLYEVHYFLGRVAVVSGDHEAASQHFARASAINPDDCQATILASQSMRGVGDTARANEYAARGVERVRRRTQLVPEDHRARGLGAHALAQLGHTDEAIQWMQRTLSATPNDHAVMYNVACLYAFVGELEKSFELLDRAVSGGYAHLQWLENDPDLDPLRGDPRYDEIISRMKDISKPEHESQ